jgi:hypothetical protein
MISSPSRPDSDHNGPPLGAGSFSPVGENAHVVSDGARIVCREQRDLRPAPEWQAHLTKLGGLNRFGDPNYRIIWGWANAEYYPENLRSFFHFERWLPPESIDSEEHWEAMNKREEANGDHAATVAFPRKGSYFWIWTCRLPGGEPNLDYIEKVYVRSRMKINRTRQEIIEESRAQRLHDKVADRGWKRQILAETGVLDIADDYAHHRKRNPVEWQNINTLV